MNPIQLRPWGQAQSTMIFLCKGCNFVCQSQNGQSFYEALPSRCRICISGMDLFQHRLRCVEFKIPTCLLPPIVGNLLMSSHNQISAGMGCQIARNCRFQIQRRPLRHRALSIIRWCSTVGKRRESAWAKIMKNDHFARRPSPPAPATGPGPRRVPAPASPAWLPRAALRRRPRSCLGRRVRCRPGRRLPTAPVPSRSPGPSSGTASARRSPGPGSGPRRHRHGSRGRSPGSARSGPRR